MALKIAINGFGRIGRPALRHILDSLPGLELAAINDLTDPQTLAHLLKHDSVYGAYGKKVESGKDFLSVEGEKIKIFAEKDPLNLPWKELGIDVVLECTGAFRDYEGASKHVKAGAKKVVISAPSKDPEKIPTHVLGVNEEKLEPEKYDVFDMGSCTTNCLAPVVKILQDNFKIEKGFMTTVHSYTNDQKILDLPHKDLRRARAAVLNIIPTTTGAAKAICQVMPELKGKLDGIAVRVPTPVGSIIDLVCQVEKETTAEELNDVFRKEASKDKLKGIFRVEDTPLVSSDYVGDGYSSILDSDQTKVMGGNLVKVLSWYDNEWAYASRLGEFAEYLGKKIK